MHKPKLVSTSCHRRVQQGAAMYSISTQPPTLELSNATANDTAKQICLADGSFAVELTIRH